nr:UDP-glucose 4-epimerase GalE [Bacilli bacterium]
MKTILVTGGLGFIGSETVIELIQSGYEPIVLDNLYNSKLAVLDRIEEITHVRPKFYEVDCTKYAETAKVFEENHIDAVIHFAGYKAVGESTVKPIEYYQNNLGSALNVLAIMKEKGVHNFIFSSSATVYGVPERVPLYETDPIGSATNPYGETKIMIERILEDTAKANKDLNVCLLRYFNPIGGHPSGLLGEDPNGLPNNLMPYVTQVAIGKLPFLRVFGNDYKTVDGTGVRDYIHVVDLAKGHVAALKRLESNPGLVVYNLGTGKGT